MQPVRLWRSQRRRRSVGVQVAPGQERQPVLRALHGQRGDSRERLGDGTIRRLPGRGEQPRRRRPPRSACPTPPAQPSPPPGSLEARALRVPGRRPAPGPDRAAAPAPAAPPAAGGMRRAGAGSGGRRWSPCRSWRRRRRRRVRGSPAPPSRSRSRRSPTEHPAPPAPPGPPPGRAGSAGDCPWRRSAPSARLCARRPASRPRRARLRRDARRRRASRWCCSPGAGRAVLKVRRRVRPARSPGWPRPGPAPRPPPRCVGRAPRRRRPSLRVVRRALRRLGGSPESSVPCLRLACRLAQDERTQDRSARPVRLLRLAALALRLRPSTALGTGSGEPQVLRQAQDERGCPIRRSRRGVHARLHVRGGRRRSPARSIRCRRRAAATPRSRSRRWGCGAR